MAATAASALMINTVNRAGIRGQRRLNVCLLSYNQVQIPLAEPCPQQNFFLIKRFRYCTTFQYALPFENMLLPNSFTHASYTHQQYNCSGNERAKAANWDGNNISNPATLTAPSTLTTISQYMHAQTSTLEQCGSLCMWKSTHKSRTNTEHKLMHLFYQYSSFSW